MVRSERDRERNSGIYSADLQPSKMKPLRRYLCQTRGEDATEIAFKRVNDVFWYSLQAVQGM